MAAVDSVEEVHLLLNAQCRASLTLACVSAPLIFVAASFDALAFACGCVYAILTIALYCSIVRALMLDRSTLRRAARALALKIACFAAFGFFIAGRGGVGAAYAAVGMILSLFTGGLLYAIRSGRERADKR